MQLNELSETRPPVPSSQCFHANMPKHRGGVGVIITYMYVSQSAIIICNKGLVFSATYISTQRPRQIT